MSEERFVFRLAGVLRVARLQEEMARRDVGIEQTKVTAADECCAQRAAAFDSRPAPRAGDANDLEVTRLTGELRARALVEARGQRQAAGDALEVARGEWLKAARQVRSLEELEERHRAAHATVAARAAQRTLDDLTKAIRGSQR